MAQKMNKEAPVPPKAKVKEKALKAKKAVLKGIHSHKKICTSPTFLQPRTLGGSCCSPKTLKRACLRGTSLTTIISPDHGVSHEEDRGQHISVRVDVKANKQQASDQTGCEETLTLMRPKSNPHKA